MRREGNRIRTDCAMCRQERKLVRSHIIPEFLYKAMYDSKHRILFVSPDPSQLLQLPQKGIREKLLCSECDSRLGNYEHYAEPLIFGGNCRVQIKKVTKDYILVHRVNYRLFKLFQLSILWRMSVSSLNFFQAVDLGVHEDRIRQMLLNQDPGQAHQYGCIMQTVTVGGKLLDVVRQPDFLRSDGFPSYRLLAGGFLWMWVVGSRSEKFASRQFFPSAEKGIVILRGRAENLDFLKRDRKELKNRESEVKRILKLD